MPGKRVLRLFVGWPQTFPFGGQIDTIWVIGRVLGSSPKARLSQPYFKRLRTSLSLEIQLIRSDCRTFVGDHVPKVLQSKPGWRCMLRRSGVHSRSAGKSNRKFRLNTTTSLLRVENAFIFFSNGLRNRNSRFSCD
jgi:hypothetical protein